MGSGRVKHNLVTEQQQSSPVKIISLLRQQNSAQGPGGTTLSPLSSLPPFLFSSPHSNKLKQIDSCRLPTPSTHPLRAYISIQLLCSPFHMLCSLSHYSIVSFSQPSHSQKHHRQSSLLISLSTFHSSLESLVHLLDHNYFHKL